MGKEKRATWWKMFYHQRAAIESVSDEDAGAGLKAAFRYFDGEDIAPESLTPQAFTVFCVIRPYIDESFQDYSACVKNGKQGAKNRWGKDYSPPIAPLSPPMGCLRDAEADILSPKGDRDNLPPLPPKGGKRARFVPPTMEDVAAYCKERENGIDPEEFIAFYESKGWKVGRAPMKNWKSAVITWEKKRTTTGAGKEADPYGDVV